MYKKENKSWAKHLDFTLLDIACLQLAFLLSYFLRLGISLPYRNEQYQRLAVILVMIDICVVFFAEAYKGILRSHYPLFRDLSRTSGIYVRDKTISNLFETDVICISVPFHCV